MLLAGCAAGSDDTTTTTEDTVLTTRVPASTTITTLPATTITVPPTTTTAPPPTTTTLPESYRYSIHPVSVAELAHSWHEGCPVPPEDLVRIDLVHHDFSGGIREGSIVVRRQYDEEIVRVFGELFDAGYPIVSVIPIGALPEGAEDQPGYENTSAFHCRFVAGTTRWSEHATGSAIDINVHLNPYHRGDYLWPEGSDRYLDRSLGEPGMITEGDAVVSAFDDIGWGWGGRWKSSKDYQHFSASGR